MKTTVRLDDELHKELKRLAADEGMTMTALLEEVLLELLVRRKQVRYLPRLPLPTFKGRGLQPGVDLDDSAALLDRMEARVRE